MVPSMGTGNRDAHGLASTSARSIFQEQSYAKVLSELPDVLERHTTYMNKSQFTHWQVYFKLFLAQGGIIEAYPPSDSTGPSMRMEIQREVDHRSR